jgi:hypothetical protein
MAESEASPPVGLADFLADLRDELLDAQQRAATRGGDLKLEVDEVNITLEVVHTRTVAAAVNAKAKAKFLVFTSAEVGGEGSYGKDRTRTQTLNVTLKPRLDVVEIDHDGKARRTSHTLDVDAVLEPDEEDPFASRGAASQ